MAGTAAKDTDTASVAKAAITTVLSGSRVKCASDSEINFVVEANANSPLRTLTSKLQGASCAIDGQIHKVTATFTPNGAIQANDLIASIKQGQPLIIEWKHNLYVLYGIVCDERVHSDGTQENIIHKLLLIDPRHSGKLRFVTFLRSKDDLADIAGAANISAR